MEKLGIISLSERTHQFTAMSTQREIFLFSLLSYPSEFFLVSDKLTREFIQSMKALRIHKIFLRKNKTMNDNFLVNSN